MNKRLQRLWLFFTNWMELDTFDTEEELDDQLELLHRQNIPTKVVDRTNEKGEAEFVLCVRPPDRDYARYCTGWRRWPAHLRRPIFCVHRPPKAEQLYKYAAYIPGYIL